MTLEDPNGERGATTSVLNPDRGANQADGLISQFARLYEFASRLNEAETCRQAIKHATRLLLTRLDAHSACVYLGEPQGGFVFNYGVSQTGEEVPEAAFPSPYQSIDQIQLSKDPFIVSDDGHTSQSPFLSNLRDQGIISYLGLPLWSADRSIGVLFACLNRLPTFSRVELQEITLYAKQAAGTIDHLQMLEESHRREADLNMLVDTVHRLISTLNMDELLQHIAVRLAELVGMDSCAISSFEPDPDRVRVSAQYSRFGVSEDADLGKLYYLADFPATKYVIESGEPAVIQVQDPRADPAEVSLLRELGYNTLLMLPLKAGGNPIGLMELYSQEDGSQILPSFLERLRTLSEQVALALNNARLYAKEQHARLTTETLRKATVVLSSTLELDQVLNMILEQLKQVVLFDSASLMLLEQGYLKVLAVHSHPFPEKALSVNFKVVENELARRVIEDKESIVLRDAIQDPRFRRLGSADYVRGWLAVPMVARGEVIGLLTVDSRKPGSYTNEDAQLALAFANQGALAIANARLYQSEREQRTLAEALREISLMLSSSLDLETILEMILEQIERVVPFDSGNVMLLEEDHIRVAAHRGYERFYPVGLIEQLRLTVDTTPNLNHMSRTRKPHFIPDVENDPGWVDVAASKHIASWLGAPLVTQNRLFGFISLDKSEPGFYTEEHATRLETLSGHVALALQNALNFEEMERASITDFVTGAYNHRYFHQRLHRELERARRLEHSVSLLMIDLDHFKVVNDTYGHQHGDQVLRLIATRLKNELRSVDTLARYGGEEFAVILPGTPVHHIKDVGGRLREIIAAKPFPVEGNQITLTVSIGGATFPDHTQGERQLVDYADQALYQAKQQGRNCVCLIGSTSS